jgi:phosphoglycerol transferase MdoB-like AlkP superfamily enzyme
MSGHAALDPVLRLIKPPLTAPTNAGRLAALRRTIANGLKLPPWPVALIFLTIPNLPLLLSTHGLGALPHGYLNLEYLLIGALGIFLPRRAVFLLLCLESLVDFAYGVCYTYQFSLADALASLRYVPLLPWTRVLEAAGLLALIVLECGLLALVKPRSGQRLRTAGALLLCAGLLAPVDILDGQNPFWHKDVALFAWRLTRSPALTLGVRELAAQRTDGKSRQAGNAPMASASSHAIAFLNGRPAEMAESPDVVLVLVESWGLPLDANLANSLTAPYDDPRVALKYNVSHGTAPFSGLTVPGEARELCGSALGFGILHVAPEQSRRCLPAQFHALGYRNVAIHGYVGQMFYRNAWYPDLGFDQTWFGPDLAALGLARCRGAFPGICDESIAAWIGGTLLSVEQKQPLFIYWVTLNSHLPVPANPDLPDDQTCALQPALQESAALCSWFRLVRTVHRSVQQIALEKTSRPTIFILVGDHAPPFGDPHLHQGFSSADVPWVMLTPIPQAAPASSER